jgi:SAM-dependent methyltransferase
MPVTSTVDPEYVDHWDWLAPFWDISLPERQAEEAFLLDMAAPGASVLDVACGSCRLPIRLAEAGHRVTGLDYSASMLDEARRKIAALPPEVAGRLDLAQGDMRAFSLGRRYDVINISWSFIYLLTPEDQRQALACMHEHLEDGGRLIFSVPDPKLDSIPSNLSFSTVPRRTDAFVRPDNGHRVLVWVSTEYDFEQQTMELLTFYEELDENGGVIAKTYKPLTMRFTFRQEMQYLLELCGFAVEALYGDHHRTPYRPGAAQIWVARKK